MFTWTGCASAQINSNTRQQRGDSAEAVFHTGRNMTFYGQLALRDFDNFDITAVECENDKNVKFTFNLAENVIYNDGVPYPDKISVKKSVKVLSQTTQVIWVSGEVPKNASVGAHRYEIKVTTSAGEFVFPWSVIIHKAVVKAPAESDFGHEYFFNSLSYFDYEDYHFEGATSENYKYKRYSAKWWSLQARFAEKMKAIRVNSVNIPLISLLADSGSKRISENEWFFDFTLADKFIETFLKHGSFKYIAINAIIASCDGKLIKGLDENGKICQYEIFKPEAESWANAYHAAIYKHFCEKGWEKLLLMRLEDEPHTSEYWIWAREICRKQMPGIRCGEPLDTDGMGEQLLGYIDQYIPRINVYEPDKAFFKEQQAAGKEVWCYSCCYPEENHWLNKFIDLPHSYSRLMEWTCFSYGITGFLHWGFMYWFTGMYGMVPESRFKGDGFIVYPDVEHNDLLFSARAFETASGVCDWELLNMLSKHNAAYAEAISKRVATAFDNVYYDESGRNIEAARSELLTALDAYL